MHYLVYVVIISLDFLLLISRTLGSVVFPLRAIYEVYGIIMAIDKEVNYIFISDCLP